MIWVERLQRDFIVSFERLEYPLRCGNPLKQQILLGVCVCAYFILLCECVCECSLLLFATETVVCSSHCQSRITNDTNSPRALTISTLARLTLSSREHAYRHTHTHALATHSIAHSLSRTRMKESKGRRHDATTRRNPMKATKQSRSAISSRYRVSLKCDCVSVWDSVCLCVCVRL